MAALDDAADELASIARHLRFIGETALVRELTKRMRDAAEPVPDRIREQMPLRLPARGGYAATLDADTRIGVSVRTAESNPGVSVYATGRAHRRRYRRLNAGLIEHPVYGNRSRWEKQTKGVDPDWFNGPAEAAAPQVRAGIERALEDVSRIAAGEAP